MGTIGGGLGSKKPPATTPGAVKQFGSIRLLIIVLAFAGMAATVLYYDLSNMTDLESSEGQIRARVIYTGLIMTHVVNIMILALVLIAMLRQMEIKARLYPTQTEIREFWQRGLNELMRKERLEGAKDDNPGAHEDGDA